MNIRNFSIHVLDGVEIRANLNPVSPYVHVITEDGGKVRSFRGQKEVASFCQLSLLSILELMSAEREECASITPAPESDGAEVIPLNPASRFSNIEF